MGLWAMEPVTNEASGSAQESLVGTDSKLLHSGEHLPCPSGARVSPQPLLLGQ